MENTEQKNELYRFVEKTVMESYLQLARVNLVTGEYEYLKKDSEISGNFEDEKDIFVYAQKLADEKFMYAEYIDEYLRFADPENIRSRIFGGERRISFHYKRKTTGGAKWVVFCISAPEGCSPDDPWAVFGLRDSDSDINAVSEAMSALSIIYYKILKINLTNDTFEIVKADENEKPDDSATKITDWWRTFADAGNVHEEDIEEYRQFTDPKRITDYFCSSKKIRMSCRYRRKHADGGYRWAQMDLVPAKGFSRENAEMILFVKDVHEEHMSELRHRQELVDNFNRDALTLLYNRHKFNEDLDSIKNGSKLKSVSCLYVDVHGLHELNNHLGHQKGDDMLCCVADALRKFYPEERLYRIGGDEFVMISKRLSKKQTEKIIIEMRKFLAENSYTISCGAESGSSEDIYKTVGAAEISMRNDKDLFYKNNHDEDRRKRSMNEELEKLLTEKRDAEYFLKVIATKYAGVYFVDNAADTLRYIYIPDYFKSLLEYCGFSFKKAMRLYAKKYVKSEYYDAVVELTDDAVLSEKLKDKGFVYMNYEKSDGSNMMLQILRSDLDGNDRLETVWIFSGSGIL